MDRKILSHQNQNKLNHMNCAEKLQETRQIMRIFISPPLIYLIKKNSNWQPLQDEFPQKKLHRPLSFHDLLAEKTSFPPLPQ